VSSSTRTSQGLLAPLRQPAFRLAWLAGLLTNVGTFMQAVAAGWLMTTIDPSAFMVALVQVATTAPVFLFGVFAGAAADLFDRRRLLVIMQILMFAAASFLAVANFLHFANSSLLLIISAVLAIGSALTIPAWDSLILGLADPSLLRESVTLNGVSMNAARAIGPAAAGLIIAQVGTAPVFLINAASFMGVAIVAFKLKSHESRPSLVGERMMSNIRLGLNFVRHSAVLHPVLIRIFAYTTCACCLSAVLPVFIKEQLQAGPQTLGLLFGFFGAGAIAGAYPMQKLQGRTDLAVNAGTACGGIALIAMGYTHSVLLGAVACAMAGCSWLIVLANGYGAMQAASPLWMRGRTVSLNMLLLNGAIAFGSLIWGWLASYRDVSFALTAAGVLLLATLLLHGFKFTPALDRNVQPVLFWGQPDVADGYVNAQEDNMPVAVVIEYMVPQENQSEFSEMMQLMKRNRLRSGAMRWEFCRDSQNLNKFIESFVSENWQQHLRQHDQTLEEDRVVEERLHKLLQPGTRPGVSHWTIEQC
jgi:MFS family permease